MKLGHLKAIIDHEIASHGPDIEVVTTDKNGRACDLEMWRRFETSTDEETGKVSILKNGFTIMPGKQFRGS